MVTQEQIKENYKKVLEIKDLLWKIEHKHESAMHTYLVGTVEKTLPQEDIDAIIIDYQTLKAELSELFKELL